VFNYVYPYKDHLGTVRLSYSDSNSDGSVDASEIIQERHTYPFGLEHKGYNNVVNGTENNYQTYQGQELEEELGKNTLAFQWRDCDPVIGRFNKVDRFAEKYYDTSPYTFVKNNPIRNIEVRGDSLKTDADKERVAEMKQRISNRQGQLDTSIAEKESEISDLQSQPNEKFSKKRSRKIKRRQRRINDYKDQKSTLTEMTSIIEYIENDKNSVTTFGPNMPHMSQIERLTSGSYSNGTVEKGDANTTSTKFDFVVRGNGSLATDIHEFRHVFDGIRRLSVFSTGSFSLGTKSVPSEIQAFRVSYSLGASVMGNPTYRNDINEQWARHTLLKHY
jgi:RHS repeat-associated protein